MSSLSRKFIAVLLAIWLPLFGGSALAASVAMQAMNGECSSAVAQPVEHHHAAPQADHAAHPSGGQGHDSPCDNCGVCHLACSGYLATVTIGLPEIQLISRSYPAPASPFKSLSSAPLDPPPLALA